LGAGHLRALECLDGIQDGIFVTVSGLRVTPADLERELTLMSDWWTVTAQEHGVLVQVSEQKNPATALKVLSNQLSGAFGDLIWHERLKSK